MPHDTQIWCTLLSSLIVAFVMGFVTHWYFFTDQHHTTTTHQKPVEARVSETHESYVPKFSGTERFYKGLPSHTGAPKTADDDVDAIGENHDNSVIARIKRERPLDSD